MFCSNPVCACTVTCSVFLSMTLNFEYGLTLQKSCWCQFGWWTGRQPSIVFVNYDNVRTSNFFLIIANPHLIAYHSIIICQPFVRPRITLAKLVLSLPQTAYLQTLSWSSPVLFVVSFVYEFLCFHNYNNKLVSLPALTAWA